MLFGAKKEQKWMDLIERADNEDTEAKNVLKDLRKNNVLTEEKYKRLRRKCYEKKAEEGNRNAQYWMGIISQIYDSNPKAAERWFLMAAEQGDTRAMASLAKGYSRDTNEGVLIGDIRMGAASEIWRFGYKKDEYIKWLTRGTEAGDMEAACNLAREYMIGEEVEKDTEKELELYRMVADSGFPAAYVPLAEIYGREHMNPYYDKQKQMEYLCLAMNSKDKKAFADASLALGYYYGGEYLYGPRKGGEHCDARKACYCFLLAYILEYDYVEDLVKKVGYPLSKEEVQIWTEQARSLEYDKNILF